MPARTGIAVGLNHGFKTTPREQKKKVKRHASQRVKVVREVVREVAGFAPYERRIIELLRNGRDKRALKLAKKRVGTHKRGKKKRDELSTVLQRAKK